MRLLLNRSLALFYSAFFRLFVILLLFLLVFSPFLLVFFFILVLVSSVRERVPPEPLFSVLTDKTHARLMLVFVSLSVYCSSPPPLHPRRRLLFLEQLHHIISCPPLSPRRLFLAHHRPNLQCLDISLHYEPDPNDVQAGEPPQVKQNGMNRNVMEGTMKRNATRVTKRNVSKGNKGGVVWHNAMIFHIFIISFIL